MSSALPNCLRLVGFRFRFLGSQQSPQVHTRYRTFCKREFQTCCVRYDKLPDEAWKENKEDPERTVDTNKSSKAHSVSVFEELYKDEPKAMTPVQKVVDAGKTGGYLIVIIGGLCLTLSLAYMILSELLSSLSPSSVFSSTMKQIKNHERANTILGDNIRGFGDTMSRSRKNLQHQTYVVDNVEYMRVQYQIEGSKRKGVVIVDIKKAGKGWKTRYIIIQLEGYPPGKISIVDNRHETDIEDLPEVDYSDINREFKI